ncbi:unnamed protein product [Victoria cruziana]
MEKYEVVKEIGAGNFGVARLFRNKQTKELVAIKFIERGHRIDENVVREIINHRSLRHPNIIRFKEVVLTPTHLGIVMEYAAGGELFERICNAGRFSEDEARYFFQQLISGVSYCHSMQICHRDLKLENTLLDGSPAPRLKICDFGYSKVLLRPSSCNCNSLLLPYLLYATFIIPLLSFFLQVKVHSVGHIFICHLVFLYPLCSFSVKDFLMLVFIPHFWFENELAQSSLLHSRPKSTVGTPAYIAPEVLSRREYDGKMADVWSCGVTLYVMLVGAYPFEDPEDPKNFRKTIGRIMSVQYKIPDYVHISQDCRQLLSRIFVANPAKRIAIRDIKTHPWFLKNLPRELTEAAQAVYYQRGNPNLYPQSVEDIREIVKEARVPPPSSLHIPGYGWGGVEEEDEGHEAKGEEKQDQEEEEKGEEDVEDEYDKNVKEAQRSCNVKVT